MVVNMKKSVLLTFLLMMIPVTLAATWENPFIMTPYGADYQHRLSGYYLSNISGTMPVLKNCTYSDGAVNSPLVDANGNIWMQLERTVRILRYDCSINATYTLSTTADMWDAEPVLADVDGDAILDWCAMLRNGNLTCLKYSSGTLTRIVHYDVVTALNTTRALFIGNIGEYYGSGKDRIMIYTTREGSGGDTSWNRKIGVYDYANNNLSLIISSPNECTGTYCDHDYDFCEPYLTSDVASHYGNAGSINVIDYDGDGDNQIMLLWPNVSNANTAYPDQYLQVSILDSSSSTSWTELATINTGAGGAKPCRGIATDKEYYKSHDGMVPSPVRLGASATSSNTYIYVPVGNETATIYDTTGTLILNVSRNIFTGNIDLTANSFQVCSLKAENLTCKTVSDTISNTCNYTGSNATTLYPSPVFYPFSDTTANLKAHFVDPSGMYDLACNQLYNFGYGPSYTHKYTVVADVDADNFQDIIISDISETKIFRTNKAATSNALPTILMVTASPEPLTIDASGTAHTYITPICSDADGDTCKYLINCEGSINSFSYLDLTTSPLVCVYNTPGTYRAELWVTDDYHISPWSFGDSERINITVLPFNQTGGGSDCNFLDKFNWADPYSNHRWMFKQGPVPDTPLNGVMSFSRFTQDASKTYTCANNKINVSFKLKATPGSDFIFATAGLTHTIHGGFEFYNNNVFAYNCDDNPDIGDYVNDSWANYSAVYDYQTHLIEYFIDGVSVANESMCANTYVHGDTIDFTTFYGTATYSVDDVSVQALGNAIQVQPITEPVIDYSAQEGTGQWAGFNYNKTGYRPGGYNATMFNWSACDAKNYSRGGMCPVFLIRDQIMNDVVDWLLSNMVYIVILMSFIIVVAVVVVRAKR